MGEPVQASHVDAVPHAYSQRRRTGVKGWLDDWAARRFFTRLVKRTNNFDKVSWMGRPLWQNALDLCTIQQTIFELRPDAIIETGTNRGGSSLFYANLLDVMAGGPDQPGGRVLTIDIEKLHDVSHPRVTFLLGSSVEEAMLRRVDEWLAGVLAARPHQSKPPCVMVVLDSDHSRAHVRKELEAYARFVTPGSYMLCQDGVLDVLPLFTKSGREGPLPAIREFVAAHSEFEADQERCERFIITHHPMGWLRRKPG